MDTELLAAYRARHAAVYQKRINEQEEERRRKEEEITEARRQEELKRNRQRDMLISVLNDVNVAADLEDINKRLAAYLDEVSQEDLADDKELGCIALEVLQAINHRDFNVHMCNDHEAVATLKATMKEILYITRVLSNKDEDIDLQIDMDCSRDLWLAIQLDQQLNGGTGARAMVNVQYGNDSNDDTPVAQSIAQADDTIRETGQVPEPVIRKKPERRKVQRKVTKDAEIQNATTVSEYQDDGPAPPCKPKKTRRKKNMETEPAPANE